MIYLCASCLPPTVDSFPGPPEPRECACCGRAKDVVEVNPGDLVRALSVQRWKELDPAAPAPVVAAPAPPAPVVASPAPSPPAASAVAELEARLEIAAMAPVVAAPAPPAPVVAAPAPVPPAPVVAAQPAPALGPTIIATE